MDLIKGVDEKKIPSQLCELKSLTLESDNVPFLELIPLFCYDFDVDRLVHVKPHILARSRCIHRLGECVD